MEPWARIAEQDTWWVTDSGWDQWAESQSFDDLITGQKLAVVDMSPEHRVRAAMLLVRHTLRAAVIASVLMQQRTAPSLQLKPLLEAAAMSPLARALCSQPPLLLPHVTHPLVHELFASASRADQTSVDRLFDRVVMAPDEFDVLNDAVVGVLVSRAALVERQSLLAQLINQNVLLPDALMLASSLSL
jgi:hypothetical protein